MVRAAGLATLIQYKILFNNITTKVRRQTVGGKCQVQETKKWCAGLEQWPWADGIGSDTTKGFKSRASGFK